jgi:hypothetical protein
MSKYGDKIYCKVYNLGFLDCEKNFFFLENDLQTDNHEYPYFLTILDNL